MADQTPLKAVFDQNGNVIALGQYTSADFVGVSNGGTGNSTYNVYARPTGEKFKSR